MIVSAAMRFLGHRDDRPMQFEATTVAGLAHLRSRRQTDGAWQDGN
jgi:hypothetical protein